MTISFLDLDAAVSELRTEIDAAIARVLDSGWFILGTETEAFEVNYAAYCQADHAIGVANGLDALTLSLRALNIGVGDEVIVPSHTFVATWLAVRQTGATVVPVEPETDGFNLDPARIEDVLTEKTRAIIPVHLYGTPVDLDPICDLAKRKGLAVIEDAAQAHGAKYKGRRIGAHSDLVCWSFYPSKNLGALGDAGAITTNNEDLAEKLRMLRNYGSREKYVNEVAGVNSRLDPLQAAVLSVKLKYLDEWNARRRHLASLYQAGLADCGLRLPGTPDYAEPVWHLYVIRSDQRDQLALDLAARNVQTGLHYPISAHKQIAFNDVAQPQSGLPKAETLAREVLSMPMGPHLLAKQIERVIAAVRLSGVT